MTNDGVDTPPDTAAAPPASLPPAFGSTPVPPPIPITSMGWRELATAMAIIWGVTLSVQFAVGFIIGFIATSSGNEPQTVFQQPVVVVPLSAGGLVFALCVAYVFACKRPSTRFVEAFAFRRSSAKSLALGAGTGIAGVLGISLLTWEAEPGDSMMSNLMFIHDEEGNFLRPSLIMMVFAVVVPPLEELYYRGFLYTALRRLTHPAFALPCVAIWFAGIHLFQLIGDIYLWFYVALMGTLWTVLRESTGSTIPSLVSHWIYNGGLVTVTLLAWLLGAYE